MTIRDSFQHTLCGRLMQSIYNYDAQLGAKMLENLIWIHKTSFLVKIRLHCSTGHK